MLIAMWICPFWQDCKQIEILSDKGRERERKHTRKNIRRLLKKMRFFFFFFLIQMWSHHPCLSGVVLGTSDGTEGGRTIL